MTREKPDPGATYADKYKRSDYFSYRSWVYKPFVRALVQRAGLEHGSTILDAGCGQGYFTNMFAELGLTAVGVDLSAEGVAAAQRRYKHSRVRFEVGDVLKLPYVKCFDCVFVRGCSVYNAPDFALNHEATDILLTYLRPGAGCLIFDYHTNFCARKRSDSWINHSLATIERHFNRYSSSKVFFSLKVDSLALGKWALNRPLTNINASLSRMTGIGGDAVAIVWNS